MNSLKICPAARAKILLQTNSGPRIQASRRDAKGIDKCASCRVDSVLQR